MSMYAYRCKDATHQAVQKEQIRFCVSRLQLLVTNGLRVVIEYCKRLVTLLRAQSWASSLAW